MIDLSFLCQAFCHTNLMIIKKGAVWQSTHMQTNNNMANGCLRERSGAGWVSLPTFTLFGLHVASGSGSTQPSPFLLMLVGGSQNTDPVPVTIRERVAKGKVNKARTYGNKYMYMLCAKLDGDNMRIAQLI